MDVKLKKQVHITVDNLKDNNGYRTIILDKDSVVPIQVVDKNLIKECDVFRDYLNKYYIDVDALLSKDYFVDDIDQLIIDYDDFEIDMLKTLENINQQLELVNGKILQELECNIMFDQIKTQQELENIYLKTKLKLMSI